MENHLQSYEQNFTSWTDDVPTCKDSGVGSSSNEIYRKDGRRVTMHTYEDRSFRFRRDEYNLCLYGVFDGFNGAQVSDFVMKRLPAELVLGQLVPDIRDDLVKDMIRQAFVSVDKEYFGFIGDKLAARMVLRSDSQHVRDSKLAELDEQVSSGCAATVALILNNKIFVSNVGDCQAFLCYGGNHDISVTPLSIDHNINNEDEKLRLQHLGYCGTDLTGNPLGPYWYTRCFGNYPVKGGYKEIAALSSCTDDPVIAEPEIQGPIPVEANLEFLVIATKSLCDAVYKCTKKEPQKELANLLLHHLQDEPSSSLSTVAQSTVDHIVRMYTEQEETDSTSLIEREDMTLLVRNFRNAKQEHGEAWHSRTPPDPQSKSPNTIQRENQNHTRKREEKTLTRSSARPRPTRSSTTTESSGVYVAHGRELPVDEHGRIEPYVDFGPFYKLWNERMQSADINLNHS